MNLVIFDQNIYAINSYFLYDEITKEAIVIDPGLNGDRIIEYTKTEKLNLKSMYLTHGHGDHIADIYKLQREFEIKLFVHRYDAEYLDNADTRLWEMFRIKADKIKNYITIDNGFEFTINDSIFRTLHTPGHTKGGVCFYNDQIIFTGDTLFKGSIGRTDLLGGDYNVILNSLNKISQLDKRLVVYPGHGPATTIEKEIQTNPFYRNI